MYYKHVYELVNPIRVQTVGCFYSLMNIMTVEE